MQVKRHVLNVWVAAGPSFQYILVCPNVLHLHVLKQAEMPLIRTEAEAHCKSFRKM